MDSIFRSDQGLATRNEDAGLSAPERGLFLVCDGLGGPGGGEEASRIAKACLGEWAAAATPLVKQARESGTKESREQLVKALDHGIQEASRTIFETASKNQAQHGMCSTLDLLLLVENQALVAHVGSGRVYLQREGESHLLTEDHTQLGYLRRIGKLATISQQDQPAYALRLTRAVGFRAEVKVDFLWIELEPGDRFFLVTDGIWHGLGEATTLAMTAAKGPVKDVVNRMHTAVDSAGGRDNYTSLAVDPEYVATPAPAPAAGAALPEDEASSARQKVKLLGRIPAFEYLSYQELLKILSAGELVKTPVGGKICQEGEPGGEMMLVLAGSAAVAKKGQRIGTLNKGDVFGEMSMIDAAPRSASVTALAQTNVLAFPRETLFELFREDSGLAVKFLWGVTMEMNRRLRSASNQLVGESAPETSTGPVKGPLPFQRSL